MNSTNKSRRGTGKSGGSDHDDITASPGSSRQSQRYKYSDEDTTLSSSRSPLPAKSSIAFFQGPASDAVQKCMKEGSLLILLIGDDSKTKITTHEKEEVSTNSLVKNMIKYRAHFF